MAYSTGTATSPANLLQAIVTFLVANGWTQNMSQAEGTGWRAHLSKGSVYVNFRASNNENLAGVGAGYYLFGYIGTGYSGAAAWNAQAGGPVQSGSSTIWGAAMALVNAGPYLNYHFFTDASDNVELVLERTGGVFVHFGWGQMEKAGTWTGGTVFHGSTSWNYASNTGTLVDGTGITGKCPGAFANYVQTIIGWVRADVDAFTGKWLSCSLTTSVGYGYTGKRCFSSVSGYIGPDAQTPGFPQSWIDRQTSDMNGQANLLPVLWWAERDAGGLSLLGQLPMVRASNATAKGFANGQEFTIGSDTWKVFPNFAVRKV